MLVFKTRIWRVNAWPTCVCNYQPIKTSSTNVIYLRDTSQNGGREPTLFTFIEAVRNCPAVWDVSSLAYKDTNKTKQNKTEERAAKLGFVQTFLFLHRFLFLLFFSSVSLLYVSSTTLKKWPCCKLPCLLFDTSLTCEGKGLSTFRSFPTRVCQLKFAVWRPLNIVLGILNSFSWIFDEFPARKVTRFQLFFLLT